MGPLTIYGIQQFSPEWWYIDTNPFYEIKFEQIALLSSSGVTILMSGILGRMALTISGASLSGNLSHNAGGKK